MKELKELKELYLNEIKKINKKGELTPIDSEAAMKAIEAIKNIDEICNWNESDDGYSRGMMHYSERRGRSPMTGRYISRHGDPEVENMIHTLEDMHRKAPDDDIRMTIDRMIEKLEKY